MFRHLYVLDVCEKKKKRMCFTFLPPNIKKRNMVIYKNNRDIYEENKGKEYNKRRNRVINKNNRDMYEEKKRDRGIIKRR